MENLGSVAMTEDLSYVFYTSGSTGHLKAWPWSIELSRTLSSVRRNGFKRSLPALAGSHALHSSMMDPVVKPFAELVGLVSRQAPVLPWIFTCKGSWITAAESDEPAYWARQLREPVQFQEAIGLAFKTNYRVLVEVGPGQTLATFSRQHPGKPAELLAVSPLRRGAGPPQESFEMTQAIRAS